jgi:hypothetical protein
MKRILSVLTLAAALAVIGGTVAATRLHAAKQLVSAQPASASVCADAAHCPAGSCPVGSKSAAVASAPEDENGATSNPASCSSPASCPRSSEASTAAVATKQ